MVFVNRSILFVEPIIEITVTVCLATKAIYLTYLLNPLVVPLIRLITVKHMIETMGTA
jgi:hypothetical protein